MFWKSLALYWSSTKKFLVGSSFLNGFVKSPWNGFLMYGLFKVLQLFKGSRDLPLKSNF